MTMTWLAINLRDFHRPSKAWQHGTDQTVEVSIIGANSLRRAKETAQTGNNDPWYVVRFDRTKNIIYAKLQEEGVHE